MTWSEEVWGVIKREAPEPDRRFNLHDIYAYEKEFAERHPGNNHVRETLRDKLQEFRELGKIEFLDNEGTYRRVE